MALQTGPRLSDLHFVFVAKIFPLFLSEWESFLCFLSAWNRAHLAADLFAGTTWKWLNYAFFSIHSVSAETCYASSDLS